MHEHANLHRIHLVMDSNDSVSQGSSPLRLGLRAVLGLPERLSTCCCLIWSAGKLRLRKTLYRERTACATIYREKKKVMRIIIIIFSLSLSLLIGVHGSDTIDSIGL